MMPRDALPQFVLQRHLREIFSQTTNDLDVRAPVTHHKPRKRSFSQIDCKSKQEVDTFKGRLLGVEDSLIAAVLPYPSLPQVHPNSGTEVDNFKGRLLGVEDGLIDAIGGESHPDHPVNQGVFGSSTTFLRLLQAEVRTPERQSLRPRQGLSNVRTLPAQQDSKASGGSLDFSERVSGSSHPHPGFDNHRPGSIGSDVDERRNTYTTCPRTSINIEHAITGDTTLAIPSVSLYSPSTIESDLPEMTDTPTGLNDIFVDSSMLEGSDDYSMLGTWDLSNWRTLEFTLGDLKVAREPGN